MRAHAAEVQGLKDRIKELQAEVTVAAAATTPTKSETISHK